MSHPGTARTPGGGKGSGEQRGGRKHTGIRPWAVGTRDCRASGGQEGGGQQRDEAGEALCLVDCPRTCSSGGKEKRDQQLGAEDPSKKHRLYGLLLTLCCSVPKYIFIFSGKCYYVLCNAYKTEFRNPCPSLPL